MTRPTQVSYGIMILMFVLVAWLGLATPTITILFSYFALQKLVFRGSKATAIFLFILAVMAVGYGFGYFFNQALHASPKIAAKSIPAIIKFAKEHNLELPFTDLESLKALALDTVMEQVRYFGGRATILGKQAVFFVIGLVVAVSMFLNPRLDLEREQRVGETFYSLSCREIESRFRFFYRSFKRVMGAQITISTINTGLTAIFISWISLPYSGLVIAITFFCGLLPIIGNLISNTVIVSIAFTLSPSLGVAAFVFLVVLHKLEYFLNSKIIGSRIRNPMWLTLLALIVAERVMGIPGIILAPVILDYLRTETSRYKAASPTEDGPRMSVWRGAVGTPAE
jgi:predicted PurR-regulated permease PerM